MTITKPVTALRKGDRITLPRGIRTNNGPLHTWAEVLRIANTPYGLVIQCSHGIHLNANRTDVIQVIP